MSCLCPNCLNGKEPCIRLASKDPLVIEAVRKNDFKEYANKDLHLLYEYIANNTDKFPKIIESVIDSEEGIRRGLEKYLALNIKEDETGNFTHRGLTRCRSCEQIVIDCDEDIDDVVKLIAGKD